MKKWKELVIEKSAESGKFPSNRIFMLRIIHTYEYKGARRSLVQRFRVVVSASLSMRRFRIVTPWSALKPVRRRRRRRRRRHHHHLPTNRQILTVPKFYGKPRTCSKDEQWVDPAWGVLKSVEELPQGWPSKYTSRWQRAAHPYWYLVILLYKR